jgi:tRNA/rRNA methyltransferase
MPSASLANVRVVLTRPSHPGNIGAAARAMKTMGLEDLRLVQPARFPDAAATSLASGAVDVLERARVHETLEAALADCVMSVGFTARPRDLSHPARSLRDVVPEVLAPAAQGRVALVFGNETFGLSNEELVRCSALAHIPANPVYSSLNLAAAVQVACYELSLGAHAFAIPAGPARNAATGEEIEALFAHWERAMIESGFLDPAQPKRLMERLRRLFARAGLEREEVRFLRGMLTSFQKPKPGTQSDIE